MKQCLRIRCLPVVCTLEAQQWPCKEEAGFHCVLLGAVLPHRWRYITNKESENCTASHLCMLGVAAALLHPEVWLTAAWLCGASPTQHWCLPSMVLQCQLGGSTIHCPRNASTACGQVGLGAAVMGPASGS